jgi:hypothetical protein
VPTSDPDVNILHAAKHPIVAQYLGIGLGDADSSRFERQTTIPPSTSKKRPHATVEGTPPSRKQGKQTSKKRSVSTPLSEPAKKTQKSRSDNGRAVSSRPKTNALTRTKISSTVPVESNNENAALSNSQRALSSKTFALSEQTAQRLKAWKFQPSLPTFHTDDPNDHAISITNHPINTLASFTSNVKPISHVATDDHVSLLSPITSLDTVRGSQGYGHSIYSNTYSPSSSHLTTNKSHPEPQSALIPSRPPPSTGHVLETIFEESPPSSCHRAEELPGVVSESSAAPIPESANPSSISGELDVSSDFFQDDFFDELDDEDLLDLADSIASPSKEASSASNQSYYTVTSSKNRHVDLNLIEIASDDEWNVLDDEEVAFIDLTNNLRPTTLPPLSTSSANTRSKTSAAKALAANKTHDKIAQTQSPVSRQSPTSSPGQKNESNLTAAEATKDCLNGIIHPPIIRPPFPKPIRDRSPLIGVSSSLILKTCFRIGECLNVGCTFARNSNTQSSDTIIIELYAKVVSSHRDANGVTQHFILADLFHEKRGPFLNAACETWKGCELWEYDCGRFLGAEKDMEKKICRAVGRMKREGGKWKFVVLNVWEATWEDVEFVRGIVCGD